jgi:hypothetical protein
VLGRKIEISLTAVGCLALSYGGYLFLDSAWYLAGLPLVLAVEFRRPLWEALQWPLDREQKVRKALAIITIGFFAMVVFHYVLGMFNNVGFPRNTFLPGPTARFSDFYGTHDMWTRFGFNGVGYGMTYFPSTYLFVEPFRWFDTAQHAVAVFLTLFSVFMGVYYYVNLRSANPLESVRNVAICFMSYPFLFTFHTANFELVLFAALVGFIYLYQQEQRRPALTGLLLAIPVSMKLFPAVFFILLLSGKRYKEMLWTVAWAAVLTLIPLLVFSGGIRSGFGGYWSRLQASHNMYKELMIIAGGGVHQGHSILGALRILGHSKLRPEVMPKVLFPYLACTMAVFVAVSAYVLCRERVLWKKVALLLICMNLLPYVSGDYKLLHLFIPFFLFIRSDQPEKYDLGFTVLFALLFVSKDFTYFNGCPYHTLNQVLNPLLMLFLGGLIIVPGLRQRVAVPAVPAGILPMQRQPQPEPLAA